MRSLFLSGSDLNMLVIILPYAVLLLAIDYTHTHTHRYGIPTAGRSSSEAGWRGLRGMLCVQAGPRIRLVPHIPTYG